MKAVLLVLILLAIGYSSTSPLQFQFGNNLARFVRNQGVIPFYCVGGSGVYTFTFSNLPVGWTQNGNSIIVPNMNTLRGNYMIRVYVQDTLGNKLQGNINLIINGLAVTIQSANNNQSSGFTGNLGLSTGSQNPENIGSGSSPLGGSGSGSSPTGGSGTGTPVSDLYSNFPGLPAGTNITPNQGSNFPSRPSPSGTPSTPNIVPNIIRNIQAPFVPQRDSTPLTVEQVKRNAIFNRQINANKAVANLVAIIQQLTANVNAARNDIPLLEQALSDAQITYQDCTNEIFGITDTRTKIQNALANRQQRINAANERINSALDALQQLNRALDGLIRQRTAAQNEVSPNSQRLNQLQRQLQNCLNKLAIAQDRLANLNGQISTLETRIQSTRNNVNNAPFEIERIDIQIPIIDDRISNLQRQLANARQQKIDLQSQRRQFQRIISTGTTQINRLETQTQTLRTQLPSLQARVDQIQSQCSQIRFQLNQFRDQLAQNQVSFQILLQQIATQQLLIDEKQDQIDQIRSTIEGLPAQINLLNSELARVNSNLNRQYFICNSLADNVRKAKQNLDALSMRLESQTGWLQQANLNLERARSEKQLADIAVEEIIGTYTNSLPFSIVPNGQGLTDAGNPAGNNPSGSPLGPVPVRNQVNPQNQVIIGDINSYLSRAYGASVDPARPQTVSTLYPLSIITLNALVNRSRVGVVNPSSTYTPPNGNIYDFQCNIGSQPQISGQGTVFSVQPGMIQVKNNSGDIINLQIAGCTHMEADQQNHVLGLNDILFYKGQQQTSGNIYAHSLTCLA